MVMPPARIAPPFGELRSKRRPVFLARTHRPRAPDHAPRSRRLARRPFCETDTRRVRAVESAVAAMQTSAIRRRDRGGSLRLRGGCQRGYSGKRLFDLAFVGGGFLLLLPVWCVLGAVIALAIRIESPGPILYRQKRLGEDGRLFWMLKFRTMWRNAERRTGPVLADPRDPRITRVGRVLRRFRLDELPQSLNVLLGEMSLVGPRPERPELARRFERQIPNFRSRLRVRPGVVGLAQAAGGYHLNPRRKLRFDNLYIARMSLGLDLKLIALCLRGAVRNEFRLDRRRARPVRRTAAPENVAAEAPARVPPSVSIRTGAGAEIREPALF